MVRRAHTVAQVRAAEDALRATLPAGTLIQRAAAGLATACVGRLGQVYGSRVALLVGGGDNGADALWAGARLARRGARVSAVTIGAVAEDALYALQAAGGRTAGPEALDDADLVVDGLVGIGGRGALREVAVALALAVRGHDVVAVDLPSGVDADTGAVAGIAVQAALTVSFGTYKPGLLVGAGRTYAGRVQLVDIGLDPWLPPPDVEQLTGTDVARLLPRAQPGIDKAGIDQAGIDQAGIDQAGIDKYGRGVVGVAAGSRQYPGAAVLAVGAAVRAGAGMVRFAGAPHAAEQVRSHWPEAVVTEASGADVVETGRVQAWVVGPGLGTDANARAVVEAVLTQDVPVLIDADGLTVCAQHPAWLRDRDAPTLLTPHDREFERFGVQVGDDRLSAARRLAAELGVTVLLKGDATVVAAPDGRTRVGGTGTPVLATAGTGDVLSGACGTLLAAGLDPLDAGSVGAHLHGRAGALSAGGATTSASTVLQAWPDAVREALAGTLRS